MDIFTTCDDCNGKGAFVCSHTCGNCNGEKSIPCSKCGGNGKVKCSECSGSGKSFLFFNCATCKGHGTVYCRNCSGKGNATCPVCHGRWHLQNCKYCQGIGSTKCSKCHGKGKLPNEEIYKWPIDKLKFEYEKRQNKIIPIQNEIGSLESEYHRQYDAWQEAFERRANNYEPDQPPSHIGNLYKQSNSLSAQLKDMKMEMELIDQVLQKKW